MNKFLIIMFILILFRIVNNYAISHKNDYYIIQNNAKAYSLPDTNSEQITKLIIGHLVKIISNVNQEIEIDNQKGNWVFIDTQYFEKMGNNFIKGWVPSFYMAQLKDFKKVAKFGKYQLNGNVGDADFDYEFHNDGTFRGKYFGYEEGYTHEYEGYLYRKNNVIVAENDEFNEFFYLDDQDNLFSVYVDNDDNPIKAKRLDSASQQSDILSTNTYILTGDNVNVRAEAATNGAVLVKLSRGAKVTLLKRSDIDLTVGDKKGFWAYIDTQVTNKAGESIKGWVFDYYLKEEK